MIWRLFWGRGGSQEHRQQAKKSTDLKFNEADARIISQNMCAFQEATSAFRHATCVGENNTSVFNIIWARMSVSQFRTWTLKKTPCHLTLKPSPLLCCPDASLSSGRGWSPRGKADWSSSGYTSVSYTCGKCSRQCVSFVFLIILRWFEENSNRLPCGLVEQ